MRPANYVLQVASCSREFYVPVSLQQMVLFGQHPSQGTLLKASQFLAGELSTGFTVRSLYFS